MPANLPLPAIQFERALKHHQQGQFEAAEQLYRSVLAATPVHFDATHLLGSVLAQTGRPGESLVFFEKALEMKPKSAEVLASRASALQALGRVDEAIESYKRAVLIQPRNANILFNLGNTLQQNGAIPEAINAYRSALAINPRDVDALNNLASVLRMQGDQEEALNLYDRALVFAPHRMDIAANRTGALVDLGRLDDAMLSSERALKVDANQPDAWNNKGTALVRTGKAEEALAAFEKAIELDPQKVDFHLNHGNALGILGRYKEALVSYNKALRLDRTNAKAFNLLATALQQLNRHKDAIEACKFALMNQPDFVEAQNRIAQCHLTLEQWKDAIKAADKALEMQPNHQEALFNKGMALMGDRRWSEGIVYFDKLLELGPEDDMALLNLGNALLGAGRASEAIAAFERTVSKLPNWCGGFLNLGHAYFNSGNPEKSIETYRKGQLLEPENSQLKYSIGNVSLHLGDYRTGWAGYEHRWKTKDGLQDPYPGIPTWRGEDLAGKRIVVSGEQGLGDNIQMARYLKILCDQGADVTFKGYRILHGLLKSGAPNVNFVEELDDAKFDYQIPTMSLPYAFKTRVDTIPRNVPFLFPRPEEVTRWRERIGTHGFKIGIVWQGSPIGLVDAGRSAPLAKYEALSRVPGVRLISMQKNFGLEQLETLPDGMKVETLGDDFDTGKDAFIDTAAVIANMDLVVTTDTSMAHVAGGLGGPVWTVLKKLPDWRWLLDRDDSPWYPNMRLFRQTENAVWDDVFERMGVALREIVNPEQAR